MEVNLPDKKYNIIYADPPWFYNKRNPQNKTRFGIGAEGHYSLMTKEELLALPVENIAADNCALFLWATGPRLDLAIEIMADWGFAYRTIGFTWMKLNKSGKGLFFGTGYYTKHNAELCLLGIKGKMKPISNKVSQAILEPLMQHSRKPDIVRCRIVELFGDLPRIELFARRRVEGWDAWGKEILAKTGPAP